MAGDKITILLLTAIKCQKRSEKVPKLVVTGNILTIAIDNLSIKSIEVSDCWPRAVAISYQARSHEVYIIDNISDLYRILLEQQVSHLLFLY